MSRPRLVSVNVGQVRTVRHGGRDATTAIWKTPVAGRVAVRGENIDGDVQADRRVHGGPDKAVYAYAVEDARFWEADLGREIEPGALGENLTTEGIDVSGAVVGERWAVGTTVLEVGEPRLPCFKLGIRMGDATFPDRFEAALRLGAYLRIVSAGELAAGDEIVVVERPANGFTVRDIGRIRSAEPQRAAELLSVPAISDGWRHWAEGQVRRTAR